MPVPKSEQGTIEDFIERNVYMNELRRDPAEKYRGSRVRRTTAALSFGDDPTFEEDERRVCQHDRLHQGVRLDAIVAHPAENDEAFDDEGPIHPVNFNDLAALRQIEREIELETAHRRSIHRLTGYVNRRLH
jgi:hypothetical protein